MNTMTDDQTPPTKSTAMFTLPSEFSVRVQELPDVTPTGEHDADGYPVLVRNSDGVKIRVVVRCENKQLALESPVFDPNAENRTDRFNALLETLGVALTNALTPKNQRPTP